MLYCFFSIRVEGKGDAVITDVIYSNKTSEIVQEVTPGSKKEYEVIKVHRLEVIKRYIGSMRL